MIIEKRRIANQVNDDEHRNMVCVDMTINNPQLLDVMNSIPARYDNGVSKRRASGGGVIHIRKLGVSSDTVRCNTLSTRMVKNDSR